MFASCYILYLLYCCHAVRREDRGRRGDILVVRDRHHLPWRRGRRGRSEGRRCPRRPAALADRSRRRRSVASTTATLSFLGRVALLT